MRQCVLVWTEDLIAEWLSEVLPSQREEQLTKPLVKMIVTIIIISLSTI